LSELLARTTKLQVREITNNTKIEGNQIYVIPPNSDLRVIRGVLKLSPRSKVAGPARSIDNFLTSLALDQKSNAIAVILSGAGSDGAQGLRAVKAAGGITFAQDDQSAKYDSMPRAAIATGCVDFVLPPDKIAEEIVRLIRVPEGFKSRVAANAKKRRFEIGARLSPIRRSRGESQPPAQPADSSLRKIFQLLRGRTGLDFSFYKRSTIQRRLARRLALNKIKDLEAYLKFARQHPAELDQLHQDLLIGVSSFFRNPSVFEQLKLKVFPRVVKNVSAADTVRVWVAGCSTGQEAYSIAMAYSEFAEKANCVLPLQVFASDVNGAVLEFARTGCYSRQEAESAGKTRLQRYFTVEDGKYRVIKAIRDLVIFAQHNVLLDPPFTRVDLISCRNMMIYFEPSLQQKLIPAFHYALKPNGILLLGASESIGSFHNLFSPLEQKHRIYLKKPAANWPRFDRPPQAGLSVKKLMPVVQRALEPHSADPQKEADKVVLQKYAPAGVLLSAEGEVLQFRGDVGKFMKLPAGKASFHVSKIARDGLALPIERALARARRDKRIVRDHGISLGPRHTSIDLEVVPLKDTFCYLLIFRERIAPPAAPGRNGSQKAHASLGDSKRIGELRNELVAAHDRINSLQEEHDTSIEELQASNEEVQSANEELQSLNEELETSNEELESANEELTTLNEELATRNAELRESETRLREQATLLEMAPLVARSPKDRIIMWSRGAEAMYGFTSEEALGQTPHILLGTQFQEPLARINAKLHAEGQWRGEVTHRCKDGKILNVATQWVVHYDAQKKIRAVLEVNTDITSRVQAENALLQSEGFNRTILDASPDCIKVLDLDGRVLFVNPAGRKLLETGDSDTLKSYWPGLWIGEAREHAEKAYRAALAGKPSHFVGFRLTPKGTPRWWDVYVRPITGLSGKPERILAVLCDVSEHKQQQLDYAERLKLSVLRAEIAAQTAADTPLQPTLQRLSETLVKHLDLGLARIWTLENDGKALVLQGSAGFRTHVDGADSRIPVGSGPIGEIAERGAQFSASSVQCDATLRSPDGILNEHIVSFSGFPLLVGERCEGALAVYGHADIPGPVTVELSFAAKAIAQFIHRKNTDESLRKTQAELSRYNLGLERLVNERTSALRQLVEQMEEFSYTISHDLRAPARAMEVYATVLLEKHAGQVDANGKEYLERIVRNSSRMDRMIREILTYSRLSRCELNLGPVDLDSVVRDIVDQTPGVQAFSNSIQVARNLGTVMGHEPSLTQAISNLLSNACKFVAPDTVPDCRVWTERNNGHLRLWIKDNGIGIKPEYQHRLFGVFERLHSDKSYDGNGIGLAIVRRAVERMGGRVGVNSDGTNGSQFWIELPAAVPAQQPAGEARM